MSECTHNCSTCSANCSHKGKESLLETPHELSRIKHIIGVVSGKGGVGKSSVTAMLAVLMRRRGYRVAVLDADVTGPSIPKLFGLKAGIEGDEHGMFPATTKMGIEAVSVNLLLPDETTPVIWRGPVLSGVVQQFWKDVIWRDIDYMFIDMPPGTGDVALTVFQSIPIDGIVMVTSPQELVSMIVEKGVKMAEKLELPILGMIENYAWLTCPDCGKKIHVYGESHLDATCEKYNLDVLAHIPIDPDIAKVCDNGMIELFEGDFLDSAADAIERKMQMIDDTKK